MKLCSRCRELKPKSEFNKHKNLPGGIQCQCRTCTKQYFNVGFEPRRCCVCNAIFTPAQARSYTCQRKCAQKVHDHGITPRYVPVADNDALLPQKAFIGADDVCVVI